MKKKKKSKMFESEKSAFPFAKTLLCLSYFTIFTKVNIFLSALQGLCIFFLQNFTINFQFS